MDEFSTDLLAAIHEIRDMVRLLAEPAIAERDRKLRDELRRIVGGSAAKSKSVFLMDGSRSQATIQRESKIDQGYLSTFVKQLNEAQLLEGETKQPKLSITIPTNFFETESQK